MGTVTLHWNEHFPPSHEIVPACSCLTLCRSSRGSLTAPTAGAQCALGGILCDHARSLMGTWSPGGHNWSSILSSDVTTNQSSVLPCHVVQNRAGDSSSRQQPMAMPRAFRWLLFQVFHMKTALPPHPSPPKLHFFIATWSSETS